MSRFQVAYRSSDKHALVQYYGDDTITGHTNIGNFYHDGGGTDVLGDAGSHVLFHDVQKLLYDAGEQNMQAVTLDYNELVSIDATASDVAMNTSSDTTEQISVAFTPATASNKTVTYSSSDPTKATVSSTGLITAVAAGSAVITVTSEENPNITDSVTVTVS